MNSNEFNSKEHTVKRVFNEVFDKYDLMNDIMSFGIHRVWKKKFINILNPQKKTKLIDVATGTGDIAKLYLDKIHSKGNAYCVDENKEMLKLNKQKNDNNSNIKWFCNNAENLPFEDNFFDYYTISFGIRNVKNINSTLKEAYRVLKPGGRFICLEFSKVENSSLKKFYNFYSNIIPKIGKIVVGKSYPYEYLTKSIKDFYNQEELKDKISEYNFKKITFRNLSFGIVAIHSAWKV